MTIPQRGRDPNIHTINSIHMIKDKTSLNILVSNYTNKHVTFNKGEYIRHFEPTIIDDNTMNQMNFLSTNSIMLKRMIGEQVKPDIINPPHHKLNTKTQHKLNTLLKEYESQFVENETSIRTTPLTSMTIDTGSSAPLSHNTYPIMMKNYQWVKDEIEKLLAVKVIHSNRSSWSAPIIIVPKGDGGKQLVIDYRSLNKVT